MKVYHHAKIQYKTAVLAMLLHDKNNLKIKPMAGDKRKF